MPLLEAELRRRHYSEDAIEKIFHKNALRVLREVL
jgi:microsomal dipeptidase-like Zn-dependent dipeptidase